MEFVVGESIVIKKPTWNALTWCIKNLTLENPEYYKKEKMGKWIGNTPKTIVLYEKVGADLQVPFGCFEDLYKAFKEYEWTACSKFKERVCKFQYRSKINLFDYQERAVQEALRKKNGILVMPCGSGKTQSGLEIIARLGGRALWLTHTQDLLNQSKKRAESVLANVGCGTITEGKVNIGEGITFATVQTMCNVDLSKYKDFWDIVIVDECQHCAGSPTRVTQFYKVMTNLCARYKIGLTATPHRADGLERSMFALLGNIIHEVPKEEVAHTTCPIVVRQTPTGWFPGFEVIKTDGTIDYMKVIDSLTHDQERFDLVLSAIKNLECCIVLANRVEYLQKLNEAYPKESVCLSGIAKSKIAKEERKKALNDLNEGRIKCVFATYQLAKEGLDVPNLRYIVLATPEKDETTVIQSAGRVGRQAEGKSHGEVIDFVDAFGMYKGWARKRVGFYKKIGAEVV